jgi:hypothetical protein
MGGAQVSLGGDYSSAYSNPAGLGMFNHSEFSFSPGVNTSSANATYFGNSVNQSNSKFVIPGFSLVFQSKNRNGDDSGSGFLGGSFAVTYNRINDFNQNFSYTGTNTKNSIIDYFIKDAAGLDPTEMQYSTANGEGDYFNTPTALAYNNYLLEDSSFFNSNSPKTQYASILGTFPNDPNDKRSVLQHEDVRNSGSQSQVNIAYGANISDRLFFGATLGISSINYKSAKSYTESNIVFAEDPSFNPVNSFTLNETLSISGTGFSGTFGVIGRPIDQIQLGVSYTTPTLYSITDTYSANMSSSWNNFDYYGNGKTILTNEYEYTDQVQSNYTLKTPGRLSAGATVFIQKYGFITADVESVNYSGSKFNSSTDGVSFSSDNSQIKSLYQSVLNYRVGGEYRYNHFRLRGGYSLMPDPYKTQQNNIDSSISSVSGGLGYKTANFYVDFAATFMQSKDSYRPYTVDTADSPVVNLNNKRANFIVTFGFTFNNR